MDQLDLGSIPLIRVFNKTDLVDREYTASIRERYSGIALSAVNPETFPELVRKLEDEILQSLSHEPPALHIQQLGVDQDIL